MNMDFSFQFSEFQRLFHPLPSCFQPPMHAAFSISAFQFSLFVLLLFL